MSPAGLGGQRWPFVALLTMTAVWGSTFFLIKDIVTRIPVPDLLTVRFAIATIALATMAAGRLKMSRRTLARGLVLGLLYGTAQLLQTAGLDYTAASVSGFLTGLYVVATPLLAAWILRTTISSNAWLASVLATVGLAVLSLHGFAIGYGELLTCVAALIYAGHIIALGQLSEPGEALSLSVIQLSMITAVCAVGAVASGGSRPLISMPATGLDWLIVVYLAVVASAVTMVLQTWAQARVEPSRAAVVMAMEPVWAAAFAIALGGETMTVRMIIGGLAIVAAMYLVMRSSAERGVRSLENRLDARASDLRSRCSVRSELVSGATPQIDQPSTGHFVYPRHHQVVTTLVEQLAMNGKAFQRTNRPDEVDGLLHRGPRSVRRHGQNVDALRCRVIRIPGMKERGLTR